VGQTVGKPGLARERGQRRTLQFALRAFQNQRVISLAAGLVDARHRRDQPTWTNGADVWAVVSMEVSDQPSINSRLPVPDQSVEILTHRMERISASRHLHRAPDIALTSFEDVLALEPHARQRLMVIGPVRVGFFLPPRRALVEHHARGEKVVRQLTLPFPMMLQKQNQVVQDRTDSTLLVELEVIGPFSICRLPPALLPASSAAQLGLALLLHFVEAVLENAFQVAFAETGETIRFRAIGGMQRLANGQRYLGGLGVESDLVQFVQTDGVGDSLGQA